MKLIPGEMRFTIQTSLSRKDVTRVLREVLVRKKPLFPFFLGKHWRGEVYDSGFDIRATQRLKLYLPPIYHGELKGADGRIMIRISAARPLASFRVAVFWGVCLLSILGLVYGIPELQSEGNPNISALTGALVLAAFVFGGSALLGSALYWRSLNEGKQWLMTLFENSKGDGTAERRGADIATQNGRQ